MILKILTLGLLATTLSLAAPTPGAVVAEINSKKITKEEFERKYAENKKYFPYKIPSKKDVLNDLVKRELGVQEARRLKLHEDPEILDRVDTVLYHALLERVLGRELEKIQITDADIRRYYDQNPEIRTSHIFVSLTPASTPAQVQKAMDRMKETQKVLKESKKSFAEIAQEYSEGIAAPMGGDIDFQTREKLDQAYYEAAVALKEPGRVSGIVKSQFGLHIIKLTAIKSWVDVDKTRLHRAAFEIKRKDAFDQYINGLKKKSKVVINSNLVAE